MSDKFTQAWWQTQWTGACHRLNQQATEIAALTKRADAMARLYDELVAERAEMLAEIGRVVAENEQLKSTIDRQTTRIDTCAIEIGKLNRRVPE